MTDEQGKQTKVEVAKHVKCCWTASVYGKKVADTLLKVREANELGELDALIVKQPLIQLRCSLRVAQNIL